MRCLAVMARHWEPGRAKTRLAVEVGPHAAAALHRAFVETVTARLAGLADVHWLCVTPDEAADVFRAAIGSPWDVVPQGPGDLGTRLDRGFRAARAAGAESLVVVGTDSPDLPRERVEAAFARIAPRRLVLGPAEDGGYYLIGAAEPPDVFRGVEWGTPRVREQTVALARAAGWQVSELAPWYDVDEPADLARLRGALARAADEVLGRLATRIDDVLSDRRAEGLPLPSP